LCDPTNEILFKCFFIWSNGILSVAILAFRNSIVFHNLDNLTSCAIHIIPMFSSWNFRWYTMEYMKTLPPEQRTFVALENEDLKLDYSAFLSLYLLPLSLYLFWAFLYSMKMFVISKKKIVEKNYDNSFVYMSKK
jgi:hypothetical protein